ncbi:MAG: MFS transporter [Planctomycetota bacterium]|nr:MFS transporter [Planctomycetota bacterium]
MSADGTTAVAPRTTRLSWLDGACWAAMVGLGETWFVADGVRQGASPLVLGLLITLPLAMGGAGALGALRWFRQARSRRRWVTGAACAQALNLTGLAVLTVTGLSSPGALLTCAVLHQVCAQAAGVAWSSWFADLVPEDQRGTWFARRNRVVYAATCLTILSAGGLLHLRGESPTLLALLYGLAATARLGSAWALARTPEVGFRGLSPMGRVLGFLRTSRGGGALRLVLVGAGLHLAVYLSSPYFSPFMLEELELPYHIYTAATLAGVVAKVLAAPLWGRWVDRSGPERVFPIAVLLIALVPLPWILGRSGGIAVMAMLVSGAAWAGHEVSQFTLLLERTWRGTRMHLLAAMSVLHGGAQLAGSVLGAILVERGGTYGVAFEASLGGRLLIAACVPFLLGGVRYATIRSKDLVWRTIGLRPSGAVVRRPVPLQGHDDGGEGPPPEPLSPGAPRRPRD